jgi:hypothetical protein
MTQFLIAAGAFLGTLGIIAIWIMKQLANYRHAAIDDAARSERLKPIDAAADHFKNEVKLNENAIDAYNRTNNVKLVKPSDDPGGSAS